MQKISLRNLKTESIVIAIICLALGILIFYWGFQGNTTLKTFGARQNKSVSQILLYLISIAPLLTSLNLFIRYFSLLGYGEFAIMMDHEKITYPVYKMFRGFRKISFAKNQIKSLQLQDAGKDGTNIWFLSYENTFLGSVSGSLYNPRVITGREIAEKIAAWLDKA